MVFSELYSAYYNSVAEILNLAVKGELQENDIKSIVQKRAFSESALNIIPALKNEKWQLLKSDMTTPLTHKPTIPLTLLQKRWLKSMLNDPRIKLFNIKIDGLDDIEPLFTEDDYVIYDKYNDGDQFKNTGYIERFRTILSAIRGQYPLRIEMVTRRGQVIYNKVMPIKLEYSEKDDKFRLISLGNRHGTTINLGRVIHCRPWFGEWQENGGSFRAMTKTVTLSIFDGRNALERVMMHFAHFEKQAEKIDDKHYTLKINYDANDETELVIRVLSFGPFVKVLEPESFVDLIKERLIMQKKL